MASILDRAGRDRSFPSLHKVLLDGAAPEGGREKIKGTGGYIAHTRLRRVISQGGWRKMVTDGYTESTSSESVTYFLI